MPLSFRTRTDWLLLAGFCGFLFFYGLGSFGLLGPDEPRYAQGAREMLERRDWIVPTLGGQTWLEKPPLFYWQAMLAGARKAGQDLGINILELGADSESDIDGQIKLLENAVASSPAAVVIAPAQFAALGKPIDEAARRTKIVAIDSEVGSKGVT